MKPLFLKNVSLKLSVIASIAKQSFCIFVTFCFLLTSFNWSLPANADEIYLPKPGVRVSVSPAFNPPVLKGITVDPNNPFKFDFILDKGHTVKRQPGDIVSLGAINAPIESVSPSTLPSERALQSKATQGVDRQPNENDLKQESQKLVKYFLSAITTPDKDLWVNLSPYEKDRIIPESFGQTDMGRDLLAQDYLLKQITATLMYPEDELGKRFWKRIYDEAAKRYGTTNVPVNTFNKVWIVPDKAKVYEHGNTAFIVNSHLKVMLESDYLAQAKNDQKDVWQKQIIKEIIIPELEKEVNEGKNFAPLRQVYQSLILAVWFKKHMKNTLLGQKYVNQNKINGIKRQPGDIVSLGAINAPIESVSPSRSQANILMNVKGKAGSSQENNPDDIELIYQRYLTAFKKGVYNYIKEEQDLITQQPIPRKYLSGGFGEVGDFAMRGIDYAQQVRTNEISITDPALVSVTLANQRQLKSADKAMLTEVASKYNIPELRIAFLHQQALEVLLDRPGNSEFIDNLKTNPVIYRGDHLENILQAIMDNNGYLGTNENPHGSHLTTSRRIAEAFGENKAQFVLEFDPQRLSQRQGNMFVFSTRMYHSKDSIMGAPADLRALTDKNKYELFAALEKEGLVKDLEAQVKAVLFADLNQAVPMDVWKEFQDGFGVLDEEDIYELWKTFSKVGLKEFMDKIQNLFARKGKALSHPDALFGTSVINAIRAEFDDYENRFKERDYAQKLTYVDKIYQDSYEVLIMAMAIQLKNRQSLLIMDQENRYKELLKKDLISSDGRNFFQTRSSYVELSWSDSMKFASIARLDINKLTLEQIQNLVDRLRKQKEMLMDILSIDNAMGVINTPEDSAQLIRDVDPIDSSGSSALTGNNMHEYIEEPLRPAVKVLYDLNIMTFMSTANRNNIGNQAGVSILRKSLSVPNWEKAKEMGGDVTRDEESISFSFPIGEATTSKEVEQYFLNIAQSFIQQPFLGVQISPEELLNSMPEVIPTSDKGKVDFTVEEVVHYFQSARHPYNQFVYSIKTGYFYKNQEYLVKDEAFYNASPEQKDPAMKVNVKLDEQTLGGIDLTTKQLNLDVESDKAAISQPIDLKVLENIDINGLYIKDIEIKPLNNLPQLLGLSA